MRTISKLGILLCLFVAGVSVYRWGVFYDDLFKLIIGCFIAVNIMAWAYVIEWITGKDKSDENLHKLIDSLAQEQRATKELNDLK